MVRAVLVLAALGLSGCMVSEGDVLSSVGQSDARAGDGGGVGDADPCAEPECASPSPGDVTICGRVLDVESSQPVTASEPEVRIFDLDDLRDDPLDAIALATVTPDECGWFTTTIDASLGMAVIHTGELSLVPAGPYRGAASLIEAPPGQIVRVNAYVLRSTTDEAWSAGAGLVGGTFANPGALVGAVMAIYVDLDRPAQAPFQGALVAGVVMLVDGAVEASGDYYFSDVDPLSRSQVAAAQTATGSNGAGLVITSTGLKELSGALAGCTFASSQVAAIPTMVQVQEISGSCQ